MSRARHIAGAAWQWLGWGGALFVVACIAAQWLPLLDVLGYEYATFVGALVSYIGVARTIRRHDPEARPLDGAARRAGDLLGLVAVATAISALNMVRVRNCEPDVGFAYMLVFGVGAVPLAAGFGVYLAALWPRHRGRAVAVAYGVMLVSFALTARYLAREPAIVAYDTFFGYYAGSIYDESLVGFARHLWYRLATLGAGVGLIAAVDFVRTRSRWTLAFGLLGLTTTLSVLAFRGDLGLVRDRDYVAGALGGFAQTEHFDVYYDAAYYRDRQLELLLYDHEARYEEITEFFGVAPEGRLRSFVYGSRDRRGDLMGGRNTLVAKIWLGEMHITWDGLGAELLGHEMAHLILRDVGTGPLALSTRGGIVPLMALVEGAATAAAWGGRDLDYHYWSAAMYREGIAEPIADILGPGGFWGRYSRRAYTLTGSFVRWLIDTRGPEPFIVAYAHGDFEGAYGEPLPVLDAEWRAFLAELPVTEDQQAVASYRFDRPSIFGKLCARSVATRFEEGVEAVAVGDREAAFTCFESIIADDPTNVGYRLRIARAYAASGAWMEAVEHAQWLTGTPGVGQAVQDAAAELMADFDWYQGDLAGAEATYRRLLLDVGTTTDHRRLLAKAWALAVRDRYPLTLEATYRYLAERPAPPAPVVLAELTRAAFEETSPLARYLVAIQLAGTADTSVVPALLRDLERAPIHSLQKLRAFRAAADHAAYVGDAEGLCNAWGMAARRASEGTSDRAVAEMWLRRCARGTLPPPPGETLAVDPGAPAVE